MFKFFLSCFISFSAFSLSFNVFQERNPLKDYSVLMAPLGLTKYQGLTADLHQGAELNRPLTHEHLQLNDDYFKSGLKTRLESKYDADKHEKLQENELEKLSAEERQQLAWQEFISQNARDSESLAKDSGRKIGFGEKRLPKQVQGPKMLEAPPKDKAESSGSAGSSHSGSASTSAASASSNSDADEEDDTKLKSPPVISELGGFSISVPVSASSDSNAREELYTKIAIAKYQSKIDATRSKRAFDVQKFEKDLNAAIDENNLEKVMQLFGEDSFREKSSLLIPRLRKFKMMADERGAKAISEVLSRHMLPCEMTGDYQEDLIFGFQEACRLGFADLAEQIASRMPASKTPGAAAAAASSDSVTSDDLLEEFRLAIGQGLFERAHELIDRMRPKELFEKGTNGLSAREMVGYQIFVDDTYRRDLYIKLLDKIDNKLRAAGLDPSKHDSEDDYCGY
jgi:hypothetical protein